jgi:predicted ATPase
MAADLRAGPRAQTSLAEAERTCEAMAGTYPDYGYELVELPRGSVSDRLILILDRLTTRPPAPIADRLP